MTAPLLEARSVGFAYRGGHPVLSDVSVAVTPGRSLALVGESGAGKTTLMRLLLGLERPSSGSILFAGQPLPASHQAQNRVGFRRQVQTVFQDPYSSLDPRQRVGRIVAEPLRSLGVLRSSPGEREAIARRVTKSLLAVGLPADVADRYPHQFSGGQRQRIAIARAIACEPRVLLADEPVSALDVTTRVRIIDLLAELAQTRGLTIVMVSHDLAVVASLCQHTAVLERGRIVEQGDTASVLGAPSHPYTSRLIASVPRLPS